jgi:hypothetical protein
MAFFDYKALAADGAVTTGRIDAAGRQDAARLIEQRGLTPVRIAETNAPVARRNATATATGIAMATGMAMEEPPPNGSWRSNRKKYRSPRSRISHVRSRVFLLRRSVEPALTILYKEASNRWPAQPGASCTIAWSMACRCMMP